MKRKSPNKKIFPILMVALGTLLLLGSVIVFINVPGKESVVATPTQSTASIPYSRVNRVSLIDAKAAYDLGNAKFIDTRGEPYYSQGHIPGALPITDAEILDQLDKLSPNDWIITYCTWPAEESSARVAQILLDQGFPRAMALKGGLEVWVEAGYPLEK